MADTSGDSSGIDYNDLLRRLSAYFSGAAGANRDQNNIVDRNRQSQYKEFEDARLARDKFAEAAPGIRQGTATRASLLNNYTPRRVNWEGPGSGLRGKVPTFEGGVPAALANLDPRVKALNDLIMSQELDRQTANKDDIMTKPPPIGQESALDKLLGRAGAGTSLLDALLGGGPGSGSRIDIGRLIDALRHRNRYEYPLSEGDGFGGAGTSTFSGRNPHPNDPDYSGNPTDPSGGTGVGPGMQDYYDDPPDDESDGGAGDDDPYDNEE